MVGWALYKQRRVVPSRLGLFSDFNVLVLLTWLSTLGRPVRMVCAVLLHIDMTRIRLEGAMGFYAQPLTSAAATIPALYFLTHLGRPFRDCPS